MQDRLARAKDVRGALALVERAEAPYGIVYSTDAKISQQVKTVAVFPADSHKPVVYPVSILKDHDNTDARELLKIFRIRCCEESACRVWFLCKIR